MPSCDAPSCHVPSSITSCELAILSSAILPFQASPFRATDLQFGLGLSGLLLFMMLFVCSINCVLIIFFALADENSVTLLHWASINNRKEVADLLIEK